MPRLYRFCEHERLGYVIGLVTNSTLKTLHAPLLEQAEALYENTASKARLMDEVGYRAGPWKRFRRVVMKAEAMAQGIKRRFVVTNLEGEAEQVYNFYVARGDVENRIQDLKNALPADRLSCCSFAANRFRLLPHSAADVLLHHLRRSLHGTELAQARFDTLRLRLLKVGARVRQSVQLSRPGNLGAAACPPDWPGSQLTGPSSIFHDGSAKRASQVPPRLLAPHATLCSHDIARATHLHAARPGHGIT